MRAPGLDDKYVPQLAARVQRLAARLRHGWLRLTGPGTMCGEAARRQSALAGSIGAVAVAGIILAAAGGPGGPPNDDDSGGPAGLADQVPVAITIGPPPGASVLNYLPRARRDLAQFIKTSHGRPGYAVVDFRRDLTPAQTMAALAGRYVVRVYLRVPSSLPTEVHAIPLQGNFAPLASGMRQSGRLAAATARTFHVLVTRLQPRSAADRLLRTRYHDQELASSYEAARLLKPATCACVYSVVVQANATSLLSLAGNADVRVVDPAPPTVGLDALTVFPLEPSVTDVVPRGGLFGA